MTPWVAESDYRPEDADTDINRRMRAMIDDLGLEHYSFIVLTPPRDHAFQIVTTLQTSYPEEWRGRYMAKRYFELDPVTALARETGRPFLWGQGRFLRSFKKPQRLVFDEARVFHITYGLGIPVRGADGSVSVFNVVSSDKRHLHDVTRGAYRRVSAAAFDTHDIAVKAQIDRDNIDADAIELSIRERECLAWTLEGKTAGEIATILSLSVSTVNHHALTASRKLGSLNKHHAAVKALRRGLLQ